MGIKLKRVKSFFRRNLVVMVNTGEFFFFLRLELFLNSDVFRSMKFVLFLRF